MAGGRPCSSPAGRAPSVAQFPSTIEKERPPEAPALAHLYSSDDAAPVICVGKNPREELPPEA